jgi:uncharacterized protein (TIGR02270 family)
MAPPGDLPVRPIPPIIPEIVEQHAEEAAFLWRLRDAATDQPHYTLRSLADLEERVEAHLDGLRVAGEAGVEIAWANLERFRDAGQLFTVATLVLESNNEARIEQVLKFGDSVPASRRGLFGALGWVSPRSLRGQAVAWLDASSTFRRLVGVVACSLHRADPATRMHRLLTDEPAVRARALRLAGELGRTDLRPDVARALNDDDAGCRFWAAWSAGLLGIRSPAIQVLQGFATGAGPFAWRALDLVVRLMDREAAVAWLRQLASKPAHARLLVGAAGVLGEAAIVPWLVEKMTEPALARIAGESLSVITGVDISAQDLGGNAPEGFMVGPNDDPTDLAVGMDPDENLPWPDPVKVHSWWQKEERRFARDVRYLRGLPLTLESCNKVLQDGYQRQRRAAVYELALSNPARQLLNWRARSNIQMRADAG